jgi:hypothetical protein
VLRHQSAQPGVEHAREQLRVGFGERDGVAQQRRPREIHDDDLQPARMQRRPRRPAALTADGQWDHRSPAPRVRVARQLFHQTQRCQLLGDTGHGGAIHAHGLGQLHAGRRPGGAQMPEDAFCGSLSSNCGRRVERWPEIMAWLVMIGAI